MLIRSDAVVSIPPRTVSNSAPANTLGVLATCDRKQAEDCVISMDAIITSALEETAGVARMERLQRLCLDVIKGNNLTQCFIKATNSCTNAKSVAPSDVIQKWEKVMQDLYGLCDGACPSFLEKTVNITRCTGLIRFDALYDSSYNIFCGSYQKFKSCVAMSEAPVACPMFTSLMDVLYPQHIFGLYEKNCNSSELTGTENETCRMLIRLDALINWSRMSFKPKKSRSLCIREGKLDEDIYFKVASQDIARNSQSP
ncbi:reverse transcriptase [Plakobranchus ocellatus]|uniref:Reverse transcriptase n=1 Tax=Plakobranchus ocellatus TaxID=259542 RepID=A0AAV3ZFR5_9GAST|nr:reverse transcriptase [Plakobranchus ocellatus]